MTASTCDSLRMSSLLPRCAAAAAVVPPPPRDLRICAASTCACTAAASARPLSGAMSLRQNRVAFLPACVATRPRSRVGRGCLGPVLVVWPRGGPHPSAGPDSVETGPACAGGQPRARGWEASCPPQACRHRAGRRLRSVKQRAKPTTRSVNRTRSRPKRRKGGGALHVARRRRPREISR